MYYGTKWRASSKGEKFDGGKSGFNPFILVLPAMCDLTATSLMYVGLGLTDASVFQMLRGSVVVVTALFSVIFLKRKLRAFHWLGVALVMGGTAIVGAQSKICTSDAAASSSSGGNAMIGNIIIIAAQFVVGFQMIVGGAYDTFLISMMFTYFKSSSASSHVSNALLNGSQIEGIFVSLCLLLC